MIIKARILIFSILIIVICPGFGQNLAFKTISVEDGLSNNFIKTIFKDKDGFIWLGTLEGLNRFDGLLIKSFSQKLPKSFESINTIIEDDTKNLWIGTDNGLLLFDKNKETFKNIKLDSVQIKVQLMHKVRDNIYVGTNNGLYLLNTGTYRTEHILFDVMPFSPRNVVTGIYESDSSNWWLSTLNGLISFSPVNLSIKTYSWTKNEYTCVTGIGDALYLGTKSTGLVIFNQRTKEFKDGVELGNDYILTITSDKKDRVFIGTDGGGLKIYNVSNNSVKTEAHAINDPKSISSDAVYSILIDESDTYWIGTYSSGLSYCVNNPKKFKIYSFSNRFNSLNKHVRSILPLPENDLLVGTREGLYHLVYNKNKVFHYNAAQEKVIRSNIVLSLYPYNNKVLIGTYGGGVSTYDLSTGKFNDFITASDFMNGCIYSFDKDSAGNLWIASLNGIYRYTLKSKQLEHYTIENSGLKSNEVFYIKFDSESRLWACTMQGFCIMEKGSHKFLSDIFTNTKDLTNSFKSTYIFEDTKKNIWICTEKGGLFLLDTNLKFVKRFSMENGLPDNSVCAIIEDNLGQYWISTLKGFCRLSLQTRNIHNYGLSDGLPGLVFNSGNSYKSQAGELWFCNEKGLVYFNPNGLPDVAEKTAIRFTGFYLSGKEVLVGEKSMLKQSIVNTSHIILPNKQNSIGFRFVALNYFNPNENEYLCTLEGFDKGWKQLGNNNFTFYDKLRPGNYTFMVKLANSNDISKIQVVIRQSVVKSPYFFIILLSILAFAIYKLNVYIKKYKEKIVALVMQQKASLSGKDKYKNSKIQEEQGVEIKNALHDFMNSDKPYLNSELTLADLAQKINHTSHDVSQVINQYINQNFSDFINSYRVEEFKRRMEQDDFSKYTLLALSEQCGFSSKSSFFRAFKKITGKTPAEYFKNYKKLKEQ